MTCQCEMGDLVSYEELLPYIMPAVGDVPDAIAAHAGREAAIELATVSNDIKATITLPSQRGVAHYRLRATDGYSVSAVIYAAVGGCEYRVNRDAYGFGGARSYTFDRPEEMLIFNPAPGCDDPRGIEVRAVVLPGQDACWFPRSIYDRHAELLSHGARMRLYRMKDAPWFDLQLAREEERLWRDGLRWARVSALKGGSTAPLVMRAPRAV